MTNERILEGLAEMLDAAATDRIKGAQPTQLRAFAATTTGENGWRVETLLRTSDGWCERRDICDDTPPTACTPWRQGLLQWMKKHTVTAVSVDHVSGLRWDGFIERESRVERVEFKLPLL